MEFAGDIVLDIFDENPINVDFGTDIVATRLVDKGDVISQRLGWKAPKYRWIYEVKFKDENDYLEKLEEVLDKLCARKEYIDTLKAQYEGVEMCIYMRSDFGQIGYLLPSRIIKKMALLECDFGFDILSFGLVWSE